MIHKLKTLRKEQPETFAIFIIMIASVLFRIYYMITTSVYDMQHDVGTPYDNYGHLGYIAYLMQNHQLPDFDVREAFQFWHPPLHHLASAIFLTICWKCLPFLEGNWEPIQILPFIYITISIWILYRILKLWNIQGKALIFTTLILAFHPRIITLSGSVNNDTLCVFLSFLAFYLNLLWYRNPSWKLMIGSAVSIGLAMSSKGSAAILAFPMAFLFLVKLWQKKWPVFKQLVVFGIVSLPLGMWWYVRNNILFGVPLNYIYYMATDFIGYLGHVPVADRIFNFDPHYYNFQNLYLQFEGRYTDINPIIGLLKTTVFGQWHFNYNVYIKFLALPLLITWVILSIITLAAIPSFLKKSKSILVESISVVLLFIVQFFVYYKFCLNYPFVWSMDFRYTLPLLICHGILIGHYMNSEMKFSKYIGYICVAFAGLSCICFGLLGLTF